MSHMGQDPKGFSLLEMRTASGGNARPGMLNDSWAMAPSL
jgi:hypothetical protein